MDVASGANRHLDMQLVESSSLVSVLLNFREAFNNLYISFFYLLVTVFSITCFRTFFTDPLPQLAHHQLKHRRKNLVNFGGA